MERTKSTGRTSQRGLPVWESALGIENSRVWRIRLHVRTSSYRDSGSGFLRFWAAGPGDLSSTLLVALGGSDRQASGQNNELKAAKGRYLGSRAVHRELSILGSSNAAMISVMYLYQVFWSQLKA